MKQLLLPFVTRERGLIVYPLSRAYQNEYRHGGDEGARFHTQNTQ